MRLIAAQHMHLCISRAWIRYPFIFTHIIHTRIYLIGPFNARFVLFPKPESSFYDSI